MTPAAEGTYRPESARDGTVDEEGTLEGRLAPVIKLSLKESGLVLGTIHEDDLQLLIDQLEEENEEDTDYYVTPLTIDLLEESGASAELVQILRDGVDDTEGVDIVWHVVEDDL